MSTADHEIIWTFEGDHIGADFVCNNEECEYRWTCPEGCEYLGLVEKIDSGYRHRYDWYPLDDEVWHDMVQSDCNFKGWMLADAGMIPELSEDRTPFEIGRTPVEPVWQGDEGVTWIRVGVEK